MPKSFSALSRRARIATSGAIVALAMTALIAAPASAAFTPVDGDSVWIGDKHGYGGTGIWAVYLETPADPENPGEPDFWSYCIEQPISAREDATGTLGEASDYLGDNYFGDAGIPGKVLWVLANSYPVLSLAEFGADIGIPDISENDAIEATQYAIWRYTELNFDAAWAWETEDSEDAYWYLVNGANASTGLTPADFETTVELVGPALTQKAGTLVGPFELATNQESASVAVDPAYVVVDESGAPIDTSEVFDGDEFYLDARGTAAAGSATITASALGSSATGLIISVPVEDGETPTAEDHAQTQILVAASTTTTDADIAIAWAAAAAPQLAATGADSALGGLAAASVLMAAGTIAVLARRRPAER